MFDIYWHVCGGRFPLKNLFWIPIQPDKVPILCHASLLITYFDLKAFTTDPCVAISSGMKLATILASHSNEIVDVLYCQLRERELRALFHAHNTLFRLVFAFYEARELGPL